MIAVDTNILVYAHRQDTPFHAKAKPVLDALIVGSRPWTVPWTCLHEFYSVATNPRVFNTPTTPVRAIEQIDAWMESPSFAPVAEGTAHLALLRRLVVDGNIQGPKVHDARVYALCLAHGVSELWSADRDFTRFAGLRVRNPLV
jgi:toxin-antitoxin system PIN domain toxin